MKTPIMEACVDSLASALIAQRAGADRLELCGHLPIGGVTPSPALSAFLAEKGTADVPDGCPLIALLKRDGGQQLRQAAEALRRGDMAQAQALMQPLTQDREAAELLKKINGK